MTRALVTGSSGFAGRHLVRELRERGWRVTGLGRVRRHPWELEADLRQPRAVVEAVEEARPEVVFHLAASDGRGVLPAAVLAANAGGTLHLTQALTRLRGPVRMLVVGSSAQYGAATSSEPIDEETPFRPTAVYGYSKIAAEAIALGASGSAGLEVVSARPFNHTGPGDPVTRSCPAFAAQVAEVEAGRRREIRAGNLDTVRDFTDVRDIVRGYRVLAEFGTPGRAYNLCSGRGVRMRQVLDRLRALSPGPIEVVSDPGRWRADDVPVQVGSFERAREETGWAPRISLSETLADLLADCRRRLSQPRRGEDA